MLTDKFDKTTKTFSCFGVKLTIDEWESILGVKRDTIYKMWCTKGHDVTRSWIMAEIVKTSCIGHLIGR